MLSFWEETKGLSNWKFCNLDPSPKLFSPFTPNPLPRGKGTGDREPRWRESRFGEGSEIKRAAPGGTCASLRDRGEARAHGVEKEKWEREAGGGGRGVRVGASRSA